MQDRFNMTLEQNKFVARRNIVDTIWKSARLEGLAVTFPETDAVFNGLPVTMKLNDVLTINNLKRAWYFLLDNLEADADLQYACQLNKLVGGDDLVYNAGFPRTIPVQIGGTKWTPGIPDVEDVSQTLQEINQIPCATQRAITAMLYLMRTKLFLDGNKRSSMLYANHIMIQNGCGIISIPEDKIVEFKTLLVDFYETNEMGQIMQFVYDNAIEGLKF